jgi:hypothetical protein
MPPGARSGLPLIGEIALPECAGSATVPDYDPNELPDGARRLLLGPIDSFEKLDLILALRHADDAAQRLDALETRSGAPSTVLTRALDELVGAGVVAQRAGGWVLAPDCDRHAIDELVEAWASNRTAVLNVMTHHSLERIRASAARTFADAFTLRRGGKSERGDDHG